MYTCSRRRRPCAIPANANNKYASGRLLNTLTPVSHVPLSVAGLRSFFLHESRPRRAADHHLPSEREREREAVTPFSFAMVYKERATTSSCAYDFSCVVQMRRGGIYEDNDFCGDLRWLYTPEFDEIRDERGRCEFF